MKSLINYFYKTDSGRNKIHPFSEISDPYNKIFNNLYLGNMHSIDNNIHKFNLIVNCTKHIPIKESHKTITIRIPVNDNNLESENMLKYIHDTDVLEKIHCCIQQKQNVLVHCHAGIQRSATVIACYITKYYKMTPEEAIQFIQEKRPIAFFPKPQFVSVINNVYQSSICQK